jgi:hypothetical protein
LLTPHLRISDMTQIQNRLSDHVDVFYGAADRTSDGAMAAHAYKRSVEELDTGVARELVRAPVLSRLEAHEPHSGRTLPNNNYGTPGKDERILSYHQ